VNVAWRVLGLGLYRGWENMDCVFLVMALFIAVQLHLVDGDGIAGFIWTTRIGEEKRSLHSNHSLSLAVVSCALARWSSGEVMGRR
jgi:hypothetical protein